MYTKNIKSKKLQTEGISRSLKKITRKRLAEEFPRLQDDIKEFWEDPVRNALLLGAFDREYGPNHPKRSQFISLLKQIPDRWPKEMGSASIDASDPKLINQRR